MENREQQDKRAERKERFIAMAGLIGKFGAGAFHSSKPQKLDVTMDAQEIHQVDLLVEQGLYASREAFLQSAARNLLNGASQLRGHVVRQPQNAGHVEFKLFAGVA